MPPLQDRLEKALVAVRGDPGEAGGALGDLQREFYIALGFPREERIRRAGEEVAVWLALIELLSAIRQAEYNPAEARQIYEGLWK